MKCERCGKKFTVTYAGWGYKVGGKYACSYSCMRAMEREETGVNQEDKVKVDELDEQGVGKDQICEQTGLSRQQVGAYLGRKHKKEAPEVQEAVQEAAAETGKAIELAAGTRMDEGMRREVIRILGDVLGLLKKLM